MGHAYSKEKLEEDLEFIKGEIDSLEGDLLKIDCKETNRPDLWSSEGIAREFVNRIQALRKEKDFDVTDKIIVKYSSNEFIEAALEKNRTYICAEVLADVLLALKTIPNSTKIDVENEGDTEIYLQLTSK
jgi:hypothetical protein